MSAAILYCATGRECQPGRHRVISASFSAGCADGIQPDEREMADIYAGEIKRLSGRTVTWEELDWHIRAANIITSFQFWHSYLHGSEVGRVREIYEKMTQELS